MSAALMVLGNEANWPMVILAVSVLVLFVIVAFRLTFEIDNRFYVKTPAAIIYADRLCLNGDGGPRTYTWSDFGQAFISGDDDKPNLQHLAVSRMGCEGYERFSEYSLTPIDYLAASPADFLSLLKALPEFPDKSPVFDARNV